MFGNRGDVAGRKLWRINYFMLHILFFHLPGYIERAGRRKVGAACSRDIKKGRATSLWLFFFELSVSYSSP